MLLGDQLAVLGRLRYPTAPARKVRPLPCGHGVMVVPEQSVSWGPGRFSDQTAAGRSQHAPRSRAIVFGAIGNCTRDAIAAALLVPDGIEWLGVPWRAPPKARIADTHATSRWREGHRGTPYGRRRIGARVAYGGDVRRG